MLQLQQQLPTLPMLQSMQPSWLPGDSPPVPQQQPGVMPQQQFQPLGWAPQQHHHQLRQQQLPPLLSLSGGGAGGLIPMSGVVQMEQQKQKLAKQQQQQHAFDPGGTWQQQQQQGAAAAAAAAGGGDKPKKKAAAAAAAAGAAGAGSASSSKRAAASALLWKLPGPGRTRTVKEQGVTYEEVRESEGLAAAATAAQGGLAVARRVTALRVHACLSAPRLRPSQHHHRYPPPHRPHPRRSCRLV
jgi:hypothetical protein